MDAIRRVDLQAPSARAVVHHLVDVRGTELLAGIAEFGRAPGRADRGVRDDEVDRLVFVMDVSRVEDRGKPVPRRQVASHPVAIDDGRRLEAVQGEVVLAVTERPGREAER